MTGILRGRGKEIRKEAEGVCCKIMEAEIEVMHLEAEICLGLLTTSKTREKHVTESSREAYRNHDSVDTLISDFQLPISVRELELLF